MKDDLKIYYIGFSPINGICNESFFTGSITMYPNNEKGNIFFSNEVFKNYTEFVIHQFREFISIQVKKLLLIDCKTKFLIFNDKERTKKICDFIPEENIIQGNSNELLNYLNNKEEIRKRFYGMIPTLQYNWLDGSELSPKLIKTFLSSDRSIVIQGKTGSGGINTYLVRNIDEFLKIDISRNSRYCLSNYKRNIPVNITCVIGKDILFFPISAQLIKNEKGRFIYKGGDFSYPKVLGEELNKKIQEYSYVIANDIKQLGYKGILGIDFIVDKHKNVYFMELNPRYQASSFFISRKLESCLDINLAYLQYLAFIGEEFPKVNMKLIEDINGSFLNCSSKEKFQKIEADSEIKNGYFPKLNKSVYRQIYNFSIIDMDDFERII